MSDELKLVFDEPPQRKKVPKHLADFSPAERKEFATSFGLPGYRASQVAT
ncbi:MAG: 23S rRNA (adenine(2503)-C(2))-methyltransferase RlmN, partial [Actinobacteria bacterium]|nr:23S rRNA (adenine(2503)-C(2))-methyltransferase RlmN [Actinomycetota bacterium]